ncbi:hypothetical protein TeGR_g11848 [Tetraparma gracilis]|uniref:PRA1 family protein n=1 Tax=Tetraparma gracilis TaxID=2962635 RepID=A0ABQ6MS88_9STRA|nr:hypothetical protein TeGR_g11848 [Tetraparma gracilis]
MGSEDDSGDNAKRLLRQLTTIGEKLRARLTLSTLRPLPLFLGFSSTDSGAVCLSPTAYTLPLGAAPPTPSKAPRAPPSSLSARLALNLNYFLTNYLLLSFLALLIISLTHPLVLFYCAGTGLLWYGHTALLASSPTLVVAGRDVFSSLLSPKRRTYICSLVTLVVFLFYALLPLVTVLSVSAGLCGAHAALRDPRDIEAWERGGGRGGGEEEEEGEEEPLKGAV